MKVTLEVAEENAKDFMAMLKDLPYVKIEEEEKPLLVRDLEEAIENLKLVRAGKMKAKTLDELLDEL